MIQSEWQHLFLKNYFEVNGEVKHQISGTAIGTEFAPRYASIFMDQIGTSFLDTKDFQPLVWFRYIDFSFFGQMVKKTGRVLKNF